MTNRFAGAGAPISSEGFAAASTKLGGDRAALWALLAVETKGFGFLPDRRPKILFERHIFHRRTGGRFSQAQPDISSSRSGGYSGGYSGGGAEYCRLERAMVLDATAALESASWGLGQIMGFNALPLGYSSAAAMVDAFRHSEDAQLDACVRFIRANPDLTIAFRQRDWARVAFFYNGLAYAANRYDAKLAAAYAAFKIKAPDIATRTAQALLIYLGYNPNGVDGFFGEATRAAARAFLRDRKLTGDGSLSPVFYRALIAAEEIQDTVNFMNFAPRKETASG